MKLVARLVLLCFLCVAGGAWAQGTLIPPAYYALTGAPFTATVKAEWDGTLSSRPGESYSLIYRDGFGRQRYETALGDSVRVTIYDPVKGQVVELQAPSKAARVIPMSHVGQGGPIDLAARRGFPCHAGKGWTALGVRELVGLEACGQKQEGRELWLSTAYLMPLMSVADDAQKGRVTESVVKLTAGEPDAGLFSVPADYKVQLQAPSGERARHADPEDEPHHVMPPVLVHEVEPDYTQEAMRAARATGFMVGLTVDTNGLPTNVHILRGAGHGVDEIVVNAVKQYRFKPATQDGKAVSFNMNIEVNIDPF